MLSSSDYRSSSEVAGSADAVGWRYNRAYDETGVDERSGLLGSRHGRDPLGIGAGIWQRHTLG